MQIGCVGENSHAIEVKLRSWSVSLLSGVDLRFFFFCSIPRKPLTLVECHLFTFELIDNKVVADGFEETRAYDDGRFSHR